MNPKENTRNVDLVRNVVLDELVDYWADQLQAVADGDIRVLNSILDGIDPFYSILERLQIAPPSPHKVVGLVVQRRYDEWDASEKAAGVDKPAS